MSTKEKISVIEEDVERIILQLKLLNHSQSLQIINLLLSGKTLNAGDIAEILALEQALTSQYLAKLRKAGFLYRRKEGRFSYYSLNKPLLIKLISTIESLKS